MQKPNKEYKGIVIESDNRIMALSNDSSDAAIVLPIILDRDNVKSSAQLMQGHCLNTIFHVAEASLRCPATLAPFAAKPLTTPPQVAPHTLEDKSDSHHQAIHQHLFEPCDRHIQRYNAWPVQAAPYLAGWPPRHQPWTYRLREPQPLTRVFQPMLTSYRTPIDIHLRI